ncbi:MAG: hypothetical protein MUO42_01820 [Anaerolineaceae bacterium]|nr:hypothetical protein [Anaerolineaceae bacterium]
MRGFQQVITSVGIESLVGSREWFSQALAPNSLHVYAFGQVALENQGARLNWLLPVGFAESDPLPELLDNLAMEAGLRGAKFVAASARVDDCLYETLRRAGYCLCGWQSIWELPQSILNSTQSRRISWGRPDPIDAIDLTLLQRKLLSPATQSVTTFATQNLPDFALKIDGALKGYVRVNCFNNKVLIAPVLMKTSDALESILSALLTEYFPSADALYLLQTADTGWLTGDLEKIGARFTPREELLVKHFAAMLKLPSAELNHSASSHRADTATSMLPSAGRKDNI